MNVNMFTYYKRLIALVMLLLMFSFCSSKKNKTSVTWKEVIGTVDPHGYKQGTIHYQVDGIEYVGEFHGARNNMSVSEKYTMRYNVAKPIEIEIDYWNPVFEKDERTYSYTGKIREIQKGNIISPVSAIIYVYKII